MKALCSKINLCDSCCYSYPECEGYNIEFGDGKGNDNIVSCAYFNNGDKNGISCPEECYCCDVKNKPCNYNLPTQKQLDFIRVMQEFVVEPFTGSTKQEASEYISRNIEMYKLETTDSWCLEHGYF